jgi:23S rRNA pseudouridine2605 synthase
VPARLNRFLASAGLGSRRAVDALVEAGRVTLNGDVATVGMQVGEGDEVRVDGRLVVPEAPTWILLNKPAGVVTTARDPQGRPTVLGLVDASVRVFPVGRLDRDTTGVLLLTNEGELANLLMHPRHGVEKTYVAAVRGDPSDEALAALRRGVELEDGPTAPARVRRLAPGRVEITIHEGRNRQVRRMFEAVGHPVAALDRTRYAGIAAGDLARGESRTLRADEVEQLRRAAA